MIHPEKWMERPSHLPDDEDYILNDCGMDKINTLTAFYGCVQEVRFDGNKGVSQPDIDPEDTEAEWKLFCRLMLLQHKRSSLQPVGSQDFYCLNSCPQKKK